MILKIPRLFINDLLARTNIVDIINSRIKLKKQGKYYRTCCPFHYEKNPSFTVSLEKQFYYCFGCAAKGNVIDFLMNYDHLNFIESIEEIARIHGLNIPYEYGINSHTAHSYNQNLYNLMENLSNFYQQNLGQAQIAQQYLAQRGVNNKIIQQFAIGYAPIGWDNLLKNFGQTQKNRELLIKAGMVVSNNKNSTCYDRFRNRIMFPIRDKYGRVIGFGGREINNGQPKYLNSPQTAIFHKSHHLYGFYEVKKIHLKPQFLLVVEGYIDVLTLVQFGMNHVVASLGASSTSSQIELLFRLTDNIICCYDGDHAGRKAAWNTLLTALPYMHDGCQLQFMFLPNNEDPDTLIRKEGKKAFESRIRTAMSFSTFLLKSLLLQVDLSTCAGKTKLSMLALPLIKQIPGKILRIYIKEMLGAKLGILDDYRLDKLMPQVVGDKVTSVVPLLKRTTMRVLISLLIQNPQLSEIVPSLDGLQQSKVAGLTLFMELVNHYRQNANLTTGQLLELYRGTNFRYTLEKLAFWNHMVAEREVEEVFRDSLERIYNSMLEEHIEVLIARDRTEGLNGTERRELWALSQALAKK
ncbi:DnaG protein [Candidatus Pantoea carbekii]|uniref:DNA primase n=1 Tax=Candidatus Pantoea carbekii TaxID=1235990 RepID=U3U2D0_9GAMM|nr:DnaG protein [Candidatus Pantoea carbekii]